MKEQILEILDNIHEAKTLIEINDLLGLTTAEELKELQDTLEKLSEECIVYKTKKERFILLKNCINLKVGKLALNKKGFGFVILENSKEKDVYINEKNINNARNDDIVLIEMTNKKLNEGKIVRVLNRDNSDIVGEFFIKDNLFYVRPDKKNKSIIEIPKEKTKGAVEGHKVLVKIIDDRKYLGEVVKIIGHKNDVGVDILSFVYDYEFSPNFPEEVIDYLDNIPEEVKEEETKGRLDLRGEKIFTIDGADTKDIDDAIGIKKLENGNYELGVHIADVNHYVKIDDVIDKEAYERGTSVYLVDRVLPMLPHKLSNGICSLNPNVDRLALSCIMEIDNIGNVKSYNITKTVINSKKKMTYDAVNEILENNKVVEGYEDFVEDLTLMNELSTILRKKMVKRGYLEFDSPEAKILVDENCHPIDIKLREQRTGEKLIENFMIVANETVSSDIFYKNLPCIFRVHDRPNEEKLEKFISFLSLKGYVVNANKKNITVKDLQNILKSIGNKPESAILNALAVMTQSKAFYSNENIGHFGLGSKCYSHFTSPIRRYPDLTLHRLVKDYQDNYSDEIIEYWQEKLLEISIKTSQREQDSVDCERDVEKMKMAEYMEDHIGDRYDGIISGVTEFGIFVELPNTVEGLVKIEDVSSKEYFFYNEKLQALIGKKSNKRYMFGDSVKIEVIAASKETGLIDFALVNENGDKGGNTK